MSDSDILPRGILSLQSRFFVSVWQWCISPFDRYLDGFMYFEVSTGDRHCCLRNYALLFLLGSVKYLIKGLLKRLSTWLLLYFKL